MIHQAEVSGEQLPGMQLVGRLALSAAALLLLTLAYRYYKSRASAGAQGGNDAEVDPSQDAGPTEDLACDKAGQEDASQGLRHRWASSKGATPNGRESPPAWDGPAAPGRVRQQGTPVGRERNSLRGKEEEEEGQVEEEMTHPEVRLQPNRKYSVPEEEEEKGAKTSGCILSNRCKARTQDRVPGAGSQGGPTSADQPSRTSSCHKSPGHESAGSGSGVASPGKQAGQTPLSASGDGVTLESRTGQMLGDDRRENIILPMQERVPVSEATSNMDPTINQNRRSDTRHSVSSAAEVQVGEKLMRPRQAEQDDGGQSASPATNLQGKVYDYCVQSVSKSMLKEQPSYTNSGTQSSSHQSTADSPDDCKVQSFQAPAHNSATGDGNGMALIDIPSPPLGALLMRDNGKHPQTEHQKEASSELPAVQKPPAAGRSFRRKESFHKIVENPELQVQMEGFGSPTSGSPNSCETPPISPPPGSIKSLAGSMQSLPADMGEKPTVELVAGAKFFRVPLSSESSIDIHLDLGNCYEALCLAKKQRLEGLREAALKIMSDNYLQVLRTNAIYSRLNARERELILQGRMQGRKYVTVADISFPDHPASRLCYYDDQVDTWHPLAHMPIEAVSQGCAVCSMFNYLFVAAGCEGRGKHQKPSNRVFCYNPLTNIWREICPLNQARPQCKLVALDGYLYAIGGECLYTVERYDPRLDRWTFASPLPNDTFAVAHTATACDGEIYVTGGTLRYMLLKYVGRTNTWKVSLTGGSKDRTTEMVTINGFIYRFDLNRRMGISVYRCSSKAKLWYECATHPMPFPACFQCTVVDNLVYCISRQFNLRFLADYVSPRFGTKELQNFPSPRGTLFPVTLVLPDKEAAQTRV
ncbi:kelch domain-containing protein 7A [Tiliqua scincoides]|uniref:kelch domain-containing protein 7A n=1 Tax=Tiliqua scincoides TaxID=71010 RepID=UPI003462AB33